MQKFKIEVEDGKGRWSDVRGADGSILIFDDENEAPNRAPPPAVIETRAQQMIERVVSAGDRVEHRRDAGRMLVHFHGVNKV